MAKRSYTFYCDPGHGWLKVSFKEIKALGIEDKITAHSYMRYNKNAHGWDIYLEEDCDATLFYEAKKARGEEVKPVYKYSQKSSKIRSYYYYNVRYAF
jgi:hypothetical protein